MRDPTIARNYAEVLLELARKANDLEGWGAMILDVADAMQRDERLRRFLESPRVSEDEKNRIIGLAFQDRMPRLFVRFLQTLVGHGRQMLIPLIATEYQALVDEISGRVHAQVTVAMEPSPSERETIGRDLSRAMGRTVVPHIFVNAAILGGLVVKVGDRVMDGSVRHRLTILRKRMVAARLR